jgi:hypothetical protein
VIPEKLTRRDLKWIIPTFLSLLILFCGEVWPDYRHVIHFGFKVILYLTLTAFFIYLVSTPFQKVNYRSLRLTSKEIVYEDLSRQIDKIAWNSISKIQYIRDEAAFEDITGPYLEATWIVYIKSETKAGTIIMDEWGNRIQLLFAYWRNIPDFKLATAIRAITTNRPGRWVCFEHHPESNA